MKTKEGWPNGLPPLIPTFTDLESAMIKITGPIRALTECISWTGGLNVEDQTVIKTTLLDFLEQLDFLTYHAEINGEPIWKAEIKYPFKITYEEKEEGEVKNA